MSKTPLHYLGNRGSAVVDVLGTATLSILCGHWRYAYMNSVRGDRLNPRSEKDPAEPMRFGTPFAFVRASEFEPGYPPGFPSDIKDRKKRQALNLAA